ncbi:hypothetical protein GO755_17535 [Spirosoma sp. HMF4905]|uniref:Uncharacterized protein n=1 Tax=Spirosoma arboris TaxID=2682092 RepID=A0A7K1SDJ6_9BACT|nr:hypothetical protein [Spirosoma arboris]MVM31855.1 hypothetical protein [Spirosoma arboris]
MKRNPAFIPLLFVLALSCQQEPAPFETILAGYTIQFPKVAKQLIHSGYTTKDKIIYVDSTRKLKIEWLFNPYEFGEDTIYKLPDRRQAYGINIYLKNKGDRLDSVKAALERQYKQPMLPMTITKTKDESHWRYGSAGYYCQIGSDAVLFLRTTSSPQGDPWHQFNSLRIAIGYGLSKAEQERFATTSGRVWKTVD